MDNPFSSALFSAFAEACGTAREGIVSVVCAA
jgi:hypothetical protein